MKEQKSRWMRAGGIALSIIVVLVVGLHVQVSAQETRLGRVTKFPIPRFVSLKSDKAFARRGPSKDYQVDWTFVQRGLPVQVIAEHDNWRLIRDSEGKGGWVHHILISGLRTVLIKGDTMVNLYSAPNPESAIRGRAEPGAVARVVNCRPEWCQITDGKIKGWLKREALWGISPGELIN